MGKVSQAAMAVISTILLTATAVGAAVGPAASVEAAPVSLVAAPVSGQALA